MADIRPPIPVRLAARPTTTTEYAVRYTEHSAFNGREYVATFPIGSSSDPDAVKDARDRAATAREYQARAGLPVDAVAVVCTVTRTPWVEVTVDA